MGRSRVAPVVAALVREAVVAMRLCVDAPDALGGVAPGLQVRGLGSGERVRLDTEVVDAVGVRWRSSVALVATADGVADLDGDPLGPLWRLAPIDAAADRFADSWEGFRVDVVATDSSGGRAEAVLHRRRAAGGVTRAAVDSDGVRGTRFLPPGDEPHPAVVMFHGSGGGVAGLEPSGALLASHGFATFVVGWFGSTDDAVGIRRVPVESLARAVEIARADPRVDASRVAVLGTSAGAEAALALCSTCPDVAPAAVVAISGSSVAWQALVDGRPPNEPRYTAGGIDLPWAPVDSTKLLAEVLVKNPIRRLRGKRAELHTLAAYEAGLRSPRAASAAFAVERIDAPLLLVAGERDEVWPAAVMAGAIQARRGVRPGDRSVLLPGTGHLSLRPPDLPTTVLRAGDLVFGGEPRAFADAMRTCWSEVLAHVQRHLR